MTYPTYPAAVCIVAVLCVLSWGGCSMPAVSAKRITYDSSYPIGGSSIEADGVAVTENRVQISKYRRVSKWGWFSQTVTVEEYSRERAPGDQTIKTP